jgi:regulator of protease activity HflC (stomatin/prohibitin superfamily)
MKKFLLIFFLSISLICIAVLFFPNQITVDQNEVGIVVNKLKRNGIDTTYILLPGNHWISNYKKVTVVNADLDTLNLQTEVSSRDKNSVTISYVMYYHLDVSKLSSLYKTFGSEYKDTYLTPKLRTITRHLMSDVHSSASPDSIQVILKKKIDSSELSRFITTSNLIIEQLSLKD